MTWIRRGGLDPDMKYGNKPTRCNQGVLHQSKLEAGRCDELHILAAAGAISALMAHPQPVYNLAVNGVQVCRYIADFEYVDRDGNAVTEDTKGIRTEIFSLKAKLFAALFGREIIEVRRVRARR